MYHIAPPEEQRLEAGWDALGDSGAAGAAATTAPR